VGRKNLGFGFKGWFSILLGIVLIISGAALAIVGMNGPGPCGPNCGIHNAVLNLVGQRSYSLVYGASIFFLGFFLVALPFLARRE
jgi:quinol-cytochrome oxidoreductase complex cytochrome b subunit